jgi:hypothetical protein
VRAIFHARRPSVKRKLAARARRALFYSRGAARKFGDRTAAIFFQVAGARGIRVNPSPPAPRF